MIDYSLLVLGAEVAVIVKRQASRDLQRLLPAAYLHEEVEVISAEGLWSLF